MTRTRSALGSPSGPTIATTFQASRENREREREREERELGLQEREREREREREHSPLSQHSPGTSPSSSASNSLKKRARRVGISLLQGGREREKKGGDTYLDCGYKRRERDDDDDDDVVLTIIASHLPLHV